MQNSLKILLFLVFLLYQPTWANVFDHPKNIKEISIPQLNDINCKFKQEKIIKTSNLTLESSGNFSFQRNKGIIFYTTYPIKSTNSYTTKEYRQINNIISAISNKSYIKLERDFKFFFEQTATNWTLGLMPKKDSSMYNYIKSIEICGNQKMITKIIILPIDLNKTTIWFQ